MAHPIVIEWSAWDWDAFDKAQVENKPILLSVSAVWCQWCHQMDRETYADPDVARYVTEHFVPIRVDSDQRPDVNTRYNVGGWPTTAFLTAHGGLLGGATYLPPQHLLAMLMELQRAYQDKKPELYDQVGKLARQRRERAGRVAAGAGVEASLVDCIARRVAGAYDARNGGFGTEPKFPGTPILQFLLHLYRTTGEGFYRSMLEKSLDRMLESPLFDAVEGGFFRYCARADWSQAQYEKMLEDNISLARVYINAYLLLGTERYRQVASQTADYLLAQLYDDRLPGFHGSQGANSDYFGLPTLSRRQAAEAPPVDPLCYVNWNAQAVSLLLELSWKLPSQELATVALNVLEHLDRMVQSGNLTHVIPTHPPLPIPKRGTGEVDGRGTEEFSNGPTFLSDWAQLLNALMDAYNSTSEPRWLERAGAVAREMVVQFADSHNGGFFDIEEDAKALGLLKVREKPLQDNVAAVTALLKLYQATRQDEYREVAKAALSAYVEAYPEHGESASSYAVAVDLFLNPSIEIALEGSPEKADTRSMVVAASRVPYPHTVLKPLPPSGRESPARAHLCMETVCLPPVTDAAQLGEAVAEMLSPKPSPFQNILERFNSS